MDRQEIAKKVKAIIEPYAQDKEAFNNLNDQTNMLLDLKINSAHLVDIILDTEDEFNIEIDNDTAEGILAFQDVVDIIEKRI